MPSGPNNAREGHSRGARWENQVQRRDENTLSETLSFVSPRGQPPTSTSAAPTQYCDGFTSLRWSWRSLRFKYSYAREQKIDEPKAIRASSSVSSLRVSVPLWFKLRCLRVRCLCVFVSSWLRRCMDSHRVQRRAADLILPSPFPCGARQPLASSTARHAPLNTLSSCSVCTRHHRWTRRSAFPEARFVLA